LIRLKPTTRIDLMLSALKLQQKLETEFNQLLCIWFKVKAHHKLGIYAMNSKIKGSEMPFDQDYDDEDVGANDMGTVVQSKGTPAKVP
jgi:hypothetical protein